MSQMRTMGWAALVLVAWCSVPAAWAEPGAATPGPDRIDDAMSRYNIQPALEKLGRGLANLFGGWLEIPYNIHVRASQSDTAGSYFTGAAHGLVRGVVRTAVGAYETVSFFIPYPEDYAPILPTQAYFNKTNRKERLPLE